MMKNAIYILMYSLLLGACTAEEEVIEPVIPETMKVPISFDLSMTGPATRAFDEPEISTENVRQTSVDRVNVYVYSRPDDETYPNDLAGFKRHGGVVTLHAVKNNDGGVAGHLPASYTASGVLSLSSGNEYRITAVAYSAEKGEGDLFAMEGDYLEQQAHIELTDGEQYKTPELFFGTVVHNYTDTIFHYDDVKNDPAGQTSLTGWLYRGVAGIELELHHVDDSVKTIELLADTIYTKVGASHYDDFTQAYEAHRCYDYSQFVLGSAGADINGSVTYEVQDTIFHIVGPNLLTNICTSLSLRITGENGQSFCRLRLRDTDGHDMSETRSIPSGGGNGTGIILGGEETPEYPEEGGDGEAEKNPYQVCFKRNNYYQISGNYDSLLTQKYVLRVTVNPNWDMDVSLPLDKSEGSTE